MSAATVTEPAPHDTEADQGRRPAGWLFAGVLAVALPVILYQGREQWFFLDEWDFLAGREADSVDDLLRPHNEHWSTLPILVYRVLFRFVGLHHYWPYQLCVVLLHLGAAVLLRAVMRRAGVSPWIATAAVTLFALLGSGRQNITYAFQIGFTGSLTLGLAHLLLADHDGPLERRDALGLACGLAGLLCSGVGVTMTVVVGVAVLLRRGPRMALVHVVPLAAIFLSWFVLYGREGYSSGGASLGQAAGFVRTAAANTLGQLGQVRGMGFVLGALLLAGVGVTIFAMAQADLRTRYAATVGLLVGALLFLAISGYGRAGIELFGTFGQPRSSRYVHLLGAMALPTMAAGASRLAGRRPLLVGLALVVLLIGLPGNVRALLPSGQDRFTLGSPEPVLTLPRLPLARQVPRDLHPIPFVAAEVTVGWLLDAAAAGRLPEPGVVPRDTRESAELGLSLSQQVGEPDGPCREVRQNGVATLRTGQVIVLPEGSTAVRRIVAGAERGAVAYFVGDNFGSAVRVEAGPLQLRFTPSTPLSKVRVCG